MHSNPLVYSAVIQHNKKLSLFQYKVYNYFQLSIESYKEPKSDHEASITPGFSPKLGSANYMYI